MQKLPDEIAIAIALDDEFEGCWMAARRCGYGSRTNRCCYICDKSVSIKPGETTTLVRDNNGKITEVVGSPDGNIRCTIKTAWCNGCTELKKTISKYVLEEHVKPIQNQQKEVAQDKPLPNRCREDNDGFKSTTSLQVGRLVPEDN